MSAGEQHSVIQPRLELGQVADDHLLRQFTPWLSILLLFLVLMTYVPFFLPARPAPGRIIDRYRSGTLRSRIFGPY
ncbi:hypothetical protein A6E19_20025 [Pseudomonas putida]|nr:hypothetical protein A6E24_16795 [Pseudomonas putida]OCT23144.1 hypothetical protein A6E23_19715 [Pseudomonas putida]OCT23166.1 hypothetical protein A6E20_12875 [Pseudomonas putida]OCT36126.1 hypothetical protein A6E19_20025 [Pseudomonas putida]